MPSNSILSVKGIAAELVRQ